MPSLGSINTVLFMPNTIHPQMFVYRRGSDVGTILSKRCDENHVLKKCVHLPFPREYRFDHQFIAQPQAGAQFFLLSLLTLSQKRILTSERAKKLSHCRMPRIPQEKHLPEMQMLCNRWKQHIVRLNGSPAVIIY